MTSTVKSVKIRQPDDWHLHLRDGQMLKTVLPYTSAHFARAIVMPNLLVPITQVAQAQAYRQRILAALPPTHHFTPLMVCYLTDGVVAQALISGYQEGIFTAAKLYPAHATTHSHHGVTSVTALYPLFEQMQKWGMPLLVHGEVTDHQVDIFDREACFIEQIMEPLRQHFPELKIVFEHITTQEAADYVWEADNYLAATITPQHLFFNRNHMLVGGIRPHLYCLPILKRRNHQQALRKVATSGHPRFFLGTDSAPHSRQSKESCCGCAGVFNAPNALAIYATVFEEEDALVHLEAFCSLNGSAFYNLPVNQQPIELIRQPEKVVETINCGDELLTPFLSGETLPWSVAPHDAG